MKRKAMNRIAYVEVQRQGELLDRFGKAIVPFPWTGALPGAVVGLLIGMSVKRALLIVIPFMVGGVVSWVFSFRQLFVLTGLIGKTICIILIVVMLIFPFLRVLGVTGRAQS